MVAKIGVGNKLMRVNGCGVLFKVHEWLWILNQVEGDEAGKLRDDEVGTLGNDGVGKCSG